jgi:hypothetical protein
MRERGECEAKSDDLFLGRSIFYSHTHSNTHPLSKNREFGAVKPRSA